MKNITDRLADGEYSFYEAARQLVLAQSMEKELEWQIGTLKDFLTDKMDPKQHLTTETGTVAAKRGSEPRWKVKDWAQIFSDQQAQSQARRLLGITDGDPAGDEYGKAEDY